MAVYCENKRGLDDQLPSRAVRQFAMVGFRMAEKSASSDANEGIR